MKNFNTRRFYLLAITLLALTLACRAAAPRRDNRPNHAGGNEDRATINVVAKDFSLALDASEVEAGSLTFVVQNDGSIHHDFAIRGNGVEHKTSMIEPGGSEGLAVELEPGAYTYFCTIPGHEDAGMSGTITVSSE